MPNPNYLLCDPLIFSVSAAPSPGRWRVHNCRGGSTVMMVREMIAMIMSYSYLHECIPRSGTKHGAQWVISHVSNGLYK